jgi:hypothetical protein
MAKPAWTRSKTSPTSPKMLKISVDHPAQTQTVRSQHQHPHGDLADLWWQFTNDLAAQLVTRQPQRKKEPDRLIHGREGVVDGDDAVAVSFFIPVVHHIMMLLLLLWSVRRRGNVLPPYFLVAGPVDWAAVWEWFASIGSRCQKNQKKLVRLEHPG